MALRLYYLFIFCTVWLAACTQPLSSDKYSPITDTLSYLLGDARINVTVRTYNEPNALFFVHLHDNESTAEESVTDILEQYGGQLLSIHNNEQRNISFQLNKQRFTFDPNRMFSDSGILASLKLLSQYDTAALTEIKGFAQFILSHIPDSAIVAAVHNNTNERFSILSYNMLPLKDEAAEVSVNPKHDIDDFILTTESTLYQFYKNENTNAILQRQGDLKDDGSLSIFFGKKGRPYINVEAEHKHRFQQISLLEKLYAFLSLEKKNLVENQ